MNFRLIAVFLLVILVFACALWADEPAGAQPDGPEIFTSPEHAFPKVGGYEVLWGDFHLHTTRSNDGKVEPRYRIFEAYKYGFDTISIMDHRTAATYDEVVDLANALGIILIRGIETGIKDKEHIVAVGFSSEYQPRDPHEWAEAPAQAKAYYQDELNNISNAGGIAIYAHPHMGLREPVKWGIEQGIIRGIEVKNGYTGKGWGNVKSHGTYCYPFAFDWALNHNLAIFANSDAHDVRPEGSQPVTLVFAMERSANGVIEAIRSGRTVAWFDGMLWGRKDLLTRLIMASVEFRQSNGQTKGKYTLIKNSSPVLLKAQLRGHGTTRGVLRLEPYQEVIVDWKNIPETVSVKWENLWISPKENLITTHKSGSVFMLEPPPDAFTPGVDF